MKQVTETGQHRTRLAGKSPYPLTRWELFRHVQLPEFIDGLRKGFNKDTVIRSTVLAALTGPQLPGVVDTLRNSSSPATAASLEPSSRLTVGENASTRVLLFQASSQVALEEPEEPIDDEAIAEEIDDLAEAAIGESAPDEPATVVPVAQPVIPPIPIVTPEPSRNPIRISFSRQPESQGLDQERAFCRDYLTNLLESVRRLNHPRFNWAAEMFLSTHDRVLNNRESVRLYVTTTDASRKASEDPSRLYPSLAIKPAESIPGSPDRVQYGSYCVVDSARQGYNNPGEAFSNLSFLETMNLLQQFQDIVASSPASTSAQELIARMDRPRERVFNYTNAAVDALAVYRELRSRGHMFEPHAFERLDRDWRELEARYSSPVELAYQRRLYYNRVWMDNIATPEELR